MKDIPVTFTLTGMMQYVTPLKMKVLVVTFTLSCLM